MFPGNATRKGKLSTVDLLLESLKVLFMLSSINKHVGARRSPVLSLPLRLVFPDVSFHLSQKKNPLFDIVFKIKY